MSVSIKGLICHSNFTKLMLKHIKSLETSNIPVGKCPFLEYFHEIQLVEYKYAKTPKKYVCFHFKYHLSQLLYLINVVTHQITCNK